MSQTHIESESPVQLTDYSRTDDKFRKLFDEASLKIKKTEIQNGLPKELFPVRMYALQPVT